MTAFDVDVFKAELAERRERQRSRDGGRRPHWADTAADERAHLAYTDPPPLASEVSRWEWEDRLGDEDEDRTLTDEMPAGYDPRCFG